MGKKIIIRFGTLSAEIIKHKDTTDIILRNFEPERDNSGVLFTLSAIFASALNGYAYLHSAALVNSEGQTFLFPGDSGAGKSSITRALIQRGWRYLTDDSFLLKESRMGFYLYEFKDTLKEFNLKLHSPLMPEGTLYIFFPQIVNRSESSITKIDEVSTMEGLMRSSAQMFTIPEFAFKHASLLRRLINNAKCYKIFLGRNRVRNNERIEELLRMAE